VVFLGTSGCGKTTLLKMINRLLEPDSGEISIGGHRIRDQRPEQLRRRFGYVFQNNGLFPHYASKRISASCPGYGMGTSKNCGPDCQPDGKLHLPSDQYRTAYPHELSGGQQQRVGIARALAANPCAPDG